MKTHKYLPELLLVMAGAFFWLIGLYVSKGNIHFWEHNPFDIHTEQAQSWLNFEATVPNDPWNEVAFFKNKYYNSFPLVPSLLEIPWVIFFKRATPNVLSAFLVMLLAMIAMYRLAVILGVTQVCAFFTALLFTFGTNLSLLILQGGVWPQGQVFGYCFAIFGLALLVAPSRFKRGLGYTCLSLAVGCRPFYVFMLPVFLTFENSRFNSENFQKKIWRGLLFFLPFFSILAAYNWYRFDYPWEFGHKYLPVEHKLINGSFSFLYVKNNAIHVFLTLPKFLKDNYYLKFDSFGTAFWINNIIVVASFSALFLRTISWQFKSCIIGSVGMIWCLLLLHHSNGWMQFGYRYIVDILPIVFLLSVFRIRKMTPQFIALILFSIAINLYGNFWFFTRPAETYPPILSERYHW